MTTTTASPLLTTVEVTEQTGLTYRQLDYWSRTGTFSPSGAEAWGSGTRRLYTLDDVAVLKVLRVLSALGAKGETMEAAVPGIRAHVDEEGLTGVLYVTAGGQVSRVVLGAGWAVDLAALA